MMMMGINLNVCLEVVRRKGDAAQLVGFHIVLAFNYPLTTQTPSWLTKHCWRLWILFRLHI